MDDKYIMEQAPDNILDASQLSLDGDFDVQITEILTRVRLTRREVENLQLLLDDLQGYLSYTWAGCEVHPFGSIVTGLGIKTSDIDCFMKLSQAYKGTRGKVSPVIVARDTLRKFPSIFSQLFAIASAKVPILKCVHIPTGFSCDVNFTSFSGVRNSKLIAFLLNLDSRALTLAIIIKYWSKVYNFTGTNLMPNYALTLMVIFYLQVKSILPSVAELQRHEKYQLVENWNTAFSDKYAYVADCDEPLYELLGGFFNYYSKFDYTQHVLTPFMGCPLKKQLLADLNMLSEYKLYKENLSAKKCKIIRLDTPLCIQDPFEHSRNCSVGVTAKLFKRIQAHFKFAADIFNEVERNNFLGTLLNMDPHRPESSTPNTKNKNKNKVGKKGRWKDQRQARQTARQHFNRWQMETRRFHKDVTPIFF